MISIRLMLVAMLTAVAHVHAAADEQKKRDWDLFYALMDGNSELVRTSIQNGADINAVTDDSSIGYKTAITNCRKGDTPLHIASRSGLREVVEMLLECGANKQAKNAWGDMPKDVAKLNGHQDIEKLIEDYESIPDTKEPEED